MLWLFLHCWSRWLVLWKQTFSRWLFPSWAGSKLVIKHNVIGKLKVFSAFISNQPVPSDFARWRPKSSSRPFSLTVAVPLRAWYHLHLTRVRLLVWVLSGASAVHGYSLDLDIKSRGFFPVVWVPGDFLNRQDAGALVNFSSAAQTRV